MKVPVMVILRDPEEVAVAFLQLGREVTFMVTLETSETLLLMQKVRASPAQALTKGRAKEAILDFC